MSDTNPPANSGKFDAILHKKVAGIPVMGIAAVGAGILLFIAWKMKGTSTSATNVPASSTDLVAAGDGNSDNEQPDFAANDYSAVPASQVSLSTGQAAPTTNDEWGQEVTTWLMSNGYDSVD